MGPEYLGRRFDLMKMAMLRSMVCACVFLSHGMIGSAWAQVDETRARKIVSGVCFVCHGMEGEASSEMFPRLAGQHWAYIAKQLENFQSGRRKSTAMGGMVSKLSADEMAAIGRFFEKQSVPSALSRNSEQAEAGRRLYLMGNPGSGLPACAGCHGPMALGAPHLPRLAGQHSSYIEAQLKQFHLRERTNDNEIMQTIASKMTPHEMASVAEFLAGL